MGRGAQCAPDRACSPPVRPAAGSPSLVRRADSIRPAGMFPHRSGGFRRLRAAGESPCPAYANDRTAHRAATPQRAFCLWGRRTHGCSLRAADSRPYGKTGLRPARAFPPLWVGAHSVRPTGPVLPLCARLWALLPLCVGADSIRPTGVFPIVPEDFAVCGRQGQAPALPMQMNGRLVEPPPRKGPSACGGGGPMAVRCGRLIAAPTKKRDCARPRSYPPLCVGAHSVRPTGPVLPLRVGADSIRPTGLFPYRSGGFRRRESQRFISRLSVRPIR